MGRMVRAVELDERSVPRPRQKLGVNEARQQHPARVPIQPPEPAGLRLCQAEPGHLEEFTRAMLRTNAGSNVTLDHTASVHAAVAKLADGVYDIVLLDLGLPDAQDLEALNSLVGAAPDLPLVILTGMENEVLALQAVK